MHQNENEIWNDGIKQSYFLQRYNLITILGNVMFECCVWEPHYIIQNTIVTNAHIIQSFLNNKAACY